MSDRAFRLLTRAAAAALVGLVAAALAGPRPPQLAPAATGDERLVEEVRAALGDGTGRRGVAAALVADGETRFAGLGHPSDDSRAPVDEHTAFEIGSVAKAFTGMVLADLVEAGAVDLDERVGDLVPGTALHASGDATLAELASHRSGLPRLPWRPVLLAQGVVAQLTGGNPYHGTPDDVLDWAAAAGPGGAESASYSNFGAAVLGNALARHQGVGYGRLLRRRLLDPLGMEDTTVAAEVSDLPRPRAEGVRRSGRAEAPWVAEGFAPAGVGVWSTGADLARLVEAVVDGHAPGSSATRPRWDLGDDRIGLGWFTSEVDGRTITWHNGGTGGFRSFVGMDRDAGRAVVLLANTSAPVDDAAMTLLTEGTP